MTSLFDGFVKTDRETDASKLVFKGSRFMKFSENGVLYFDVMLCRRPAGQRGHSGNLSLEMSFSQRAGNLQLHLKIFQKEIFL